MKLPILQSILVLALSYCILPASFLRSDEEPKKKLTVKACNDFEVNGRGNNETWKKAEWVPMQRRTPDGHDYSTQFKIMYSETGVYVLFDGKDSKLTATNRADFLDLWKEDVFECFFWTDERHPVYFEYEISPLGYELPILVPKLKGEFLGWRPWHYEGGRRVRKAVFISGGEAKSLAKISNWRAEVFIPYELLKPLQQVPPKSGTEWRANFYRVDYDNDSMTEWDWARVGSSFHDIENFGTLVFE